MIWWLRILLAAVGALPWLVAAGGVRPEGLAAALHPFCHQLPERTLECGGVAMLVCSRCAGIYAGVALGALLPAPAWLRAHGRAALGVAGALLVLDVGLLATGVLSVLHVTRLGTGAFAGWCASAFLFASLVAERRDSGAAEETTAR